MTAGPGPLLYRVHVQIIEAAIPSPTVSVMKLGPLSIHLYALCIVAGILVALWLTDRRWRARGGAGSRWATWRAGRCCSASSAAGSTT